MISLYYISAITGEENGGQISDYRFKIKKLPHRMGWIAVTHALRSPY